MKNFKLITSLPGLVALALLASTHIVPAQTAGIYCGLFAETNGVAFHSAGLITVKVRPPGLSGIVSFSGTIFVNGNRKGVCGTFGTNGIGVSKPVDLSQWGHGYLSVQIQVTPEGGLSGTVGDTNGTWVSEIEGYQAVVTSNFQGQYTMILPGNPTNTANVPGGDGYGVVTNRNDGALRFYGRLADGKRLAQTLRVSPDGRWPLYSGQFNSIIMGWLSVSNGISGKLTWMKQADTTPPSNHWRFAPYTNGFLVETDVQSSPYAGSRPVWPGTNWLVTYEGAGIPPGSVSNRVKWDTELNRFVTDRTNDMRLFFLPKQGLMGVYFYNPYDSNYRAIGYGAVLTNQDIGCGYFVSSGNWESGQFKFVPVKD